VLLQIVILAANISFILENMLKHGLQADPLRWLQRAIGSTSSNNLPIFLGCGVLVLCILAAWLVECVAVWGLRCAFQFACCISEILAHVDLRAHGLHVHHSSGPLCCALLIGWTAARAEGAHEKRRTP
jgi:hypothetical protein